MRKLEFSICAGIGDNLLMRVFFDNARHNYDQIRITHNKSIVNFWRNGDPAYYKFLNEMGTLLFSEPPYIYDQGNYPPIDLDSIAKLAHNLNIMPQKPSIDHLLCRGNPLDLGEEYIVMTTKIRHIYKQFFYPNSIGLWNVLRELSERYKIVILGERDVERSKEYQIDANAETTFGIYEQIIANLPSNRIVDLTVPALGITPPDLSKIQQDCLIMKGSKFVITLGIGGNLWLALCVAKTIGFRNDSLGIFTVITDKLHNSQFADVFLSKNWDEFLVQLRSS